MKAQRLDFVFMNIGLLVRRSRSLQLLRLWYLKPLESSSVRTPKMLNGFHAPVQFFNVTLGASCRSSMLLHAAFLVLIVVVGLG